MTAFMPRFCPDASHSSVFMGGFWGGFDEIRQRRAHFNLCGDEGMDEIEFEECGKKTFDLGASR